MRQYIVTSILSMVVLRFIIVSVEPNALVRMRLTNLLRRIAFILPYRLKYVDPFLYVCVIVSQWLAPIGLMIRYTTGAWQINGLRVIAVLMQIIIIVYCSILSDLNKHAHYKWPYPVLYIAGYIVACIWWLYQHWHRFETKRFIISLLVLISYYALCFYIVKKYLAVEQKSQARESSACDNDTYVSISDGNALRGLYHWRTVGKPIGTIVLCPFLHMANKHGDISYSLKVQSSRFKIERDDFEKWNVMHYDALLLDLFDLGYDIIQLDYSEDSYNVEVKALVKEVALFVNGIKRTDSAHLIGHGVQGGIEALLLMKEMQARGVVLIGGGMSVVSAADALLDKLKREPYWIRGYGYRYFKRIIQRMKNKELDCYRCEECYKRDAKYGLEKMCKGICEEGVTTYWKSILKLSQLDINNMVRDNQVLLCCACKSPVYNDGFAQSMARLIGDSNVRRFDTYDTFRRLARKDYLSYEDTFNAYEREYSDDLMHLRKMIEAFIQTHSAQV